MRGSFASQMNKDLCKGNVLANMWVMFSREIIWKYLRIFIFFLLTSDDNAPVILPFAAFVCLVGRLIILKVVRYACSWNGNVRSVLNYKRDLIRKYSEYLYVLIGERTIIISILYVYKIDWIVSNMYLDGIALNLNVFEFPIINIYIIHIVQVMLSLSVIEMYI